MAPMKTLLGSILPAAMFLSLARAEILEGLFPILLIAITGVASKLVKDFPKPTDLPWLKAPPLFSELKLTSRLTLLIRLTVLSIFVLPQETLKSFQVTWQPRKIYF